MTTDKHRAVKLRIARKRGDLLAVAVLEQKEVTPWVRRGPVVLTEAEERLMDGNR